MGARRPAFGWYLVGGIAMALLLAGCGSAATKKAGPQPYRGALPVVDAVQFLTPKLGFIAGKGIALATSDGGSAWTRIYSGPSTLDAVDFVSRSKGWALTDKGQVLSWNGGRSWRPVAPTLGKATAMHLARGGAGLILTAAGALYRSAGPGAPWRRESLQGVRTLSFPGGATAWAVTIVGSGTPAVWRSGDGGKTWTLSFTPGVGRSPGGWLPALAASGDAAWLLLTSPYGQVEHQPYVAFATTDLGRRWHEVLGAALFADQGLYPAAPASLYGLQAGPLAAAGESAYLLSWAPATPRDLLAITATSDGGHTWRQLPLRQVSTPKTPDFFKPIDLALSPPATLWLVGSRDGQGRVLVSQDGGVRWRSPTL